jgi:hypothetical protein
MRRLRMVRMIAVVVMLLGWAAAEPVRAGTDVHVGINIGTPPPPPIVMQAPPEVVVVPRTPVYYAPTVPYDVFVYGGHYYTFNAGLWYWSAEYTGPWYHIGIQRVPPRILAVPVAYYKVPPGHWKGHGRPPWAGYGRKHGGHHHDDDDDD